MSVIVSNRCHFYFNLEKKLSDSHEFSSYIVGVIMDLVKSYKFLVHKF